MATPGDIGNKASPVVDGCVWPGLFMRPASQKTRERNWKLSRQPRYPLTLLALSNHTVPILPNVFNTVASFQYPQLHPLYIYTSPLGQLQLLQPILNRRGSPALQATMPVLISRSILASCFSNLPFWRILRVWGTGCRSELIVSEILR